jgi:plastocyanin
LRNITRPKCSTLLIILLSTLILLAFTGCQSNSKTTTSPAASPTLKIISPSGGVIPVPGDVTVTVEVSNFKVVDKQGQANVPGEGHIHYYLDIDAPTTPGQPAVPPSGSIWAQVADTSYTFTNVAAGNHAISVELVNNDHTPLDPPVVRKITVTVSAATATQTPTAVTIDLVAQNMAFNMKNITVPAGASVIINFNNKDGASHNFSLYSNSSAKPPALFQGEIVSGTKTITYHFTAPTQPGTYFFRCDIHPTIMTGDFIVK